MDPLERSFKTEIAISSICKDAAYLLHILWNCMAMKKKQQYLWLHKVSLTESSNGLYVKKVIKSLLLVTEKQLIMCLPKNF